MHPLPACGIFAYKASIPDFFNKYAATALSTPPDIPTSTFFKPISPIKLFSLYYDVTINAFPGTVSLSFIIVSPPRIVALL